MGRSFVVNLYALVAMFLEVSNEGGTVSKNEEVIDVGDKDQDSLIGWTVGVRTDIRGRVK